MATAVPAGGKLNLQGRTTGDGRQTFGAASPPRAKGASAGVGGGGPRTTSNTGFNPSLSTSGKATAQAAATKPLDPYKSNTQVNPMLKESFGLGKGAITNAQGAQDEMQQFADSLADKSNENLTNAMQRGRDATAMQLADVRAGAGARGGGLGSGLSSLLQTRAAMSGNRDVQRLNADLTEKALGVEQNAREGVIRGATGVTGATSAAAQAAASAAQDQRERDQNSADIWKFTQGLELEKTKTELGQKNAAAELALKYSQPYSGGYSGSGGSGGVGASRGFGGRG